MRILVVLPSTKDSFPAEEIASRTRNAESRVSKGTKVHLGFPEKVKFYVDWPGEEEWAKVAPYILKEFKKAESLGFDAATVHCVEDPGVEEGRRTCNIPIVGFGWATYHVAQMISDRIGVVSPSKSVENLIEKQVKSYGIRDRIVSIRHVEMPLTEMRRRKDELKRRLVEESRTAAKEGADVIVPACDVMIPEIIPARVVESEAGVTVLDPELVGLRMAEMLVNARFGTEPTPRIGKGLQRD